MVAARPQEAAAAQASRRSAPGRRRGEQAVESRHSLFGEILDWMLAPLLLLWPLSIAVTYLIAKSIANVPFDQALEARVSVLSRQISSTPNGMRVDLPPSAHEWLQADAIDSVRYQVRAGNAQVVAGDASLPLPDHLEPEPGIIRFRDISVGGTPLRIASMRIRLLTGTGRSGATEGTEAILGSSGSAALVQVAESTRKRSQLANDIIKGVILPQFIILPLALVLVWFGLTRGIAPLHTLQINLRSRRPDDLSPLDAAQTPQEIAPLIASFNELLARLGENTDMQKRFVAQAAHQMKTPLAGLRMQAELALRHPVTGDVQRSLEQIAASSGQAARLVNQLLALARAENQAARQNAEPVDLAELVTTVVQDWVPPALAKHIDLGFEDLRIGTALRLDGNALMLREMVGNLIDNAIRYTPEGGRLTVRLGVQPASGTATHVLSTTMSVHEASIEIEDTGPGIPPHERAKVFERFYRILGRGGEGSGLGLSIVREIVDMHHGSIEIRDPLPLACPASDTGKTPSGTLILITLPLAAPGPVPAYTLMSSET